ncbi:MAG: hypothetical protein RMX96_05595 [Nostoc sp. ChiSLP02]|nr:hypothetical protein [Nostoc sp. DedSLP05]MDZ8103749.1 hypothetical protein [Nostoc sp. DedSLP01]MDZ8184324.1 hypothetical protein [Nostoc sp. ChiSLP02]
MYKGLVADNEPNFQFVPLSLWLFLLSYFFAPNRFFDNHQTASCIFSDRQILLRDRIPKTLA